jgi:lipopolysaccharide transport system permease protein
MEENTNLATSAESWDLEIKPQAHLLDINLKEVWKYRDLLWMFVKRDFTAQYKQTILGPLWHFIQPLFTTVVFLVVFTNIATSSTFVANAGIFGKVYFPRLVIPLSTVMSNIVKFGIQFLLLLAAMIWYKITSTSFNLSQPLSTIVLIPVIILIMAGLGLGLGIIISSMTTKYRDLTVLIGFAVQLLMYATPVAYPLSTITSEKLRFWITLNPLTPLVEAFRYAILGVGSFDAESFGYSIGFMATTLFIGLLIFSRVEKTFMDTV